MISSKNKLIDIDDKDKLFTLQYDPSGTKLAKIPEWLKNTEWTVGTDYDANSRISIKEDVIEINVKAPKGIKQKSSTGLHIIAVNSMNAVANITEVVIENTYQISYTTALNKKLGLQFYLNDDYTSGQFIFNNYDFLQITFSITRTSYQNVKLN
ncbi:MAG: hypothetical protein KAH18_06655 [Psychromonas sp.]|nr:hypothetical protein [Psychromonas sp.]